MNITQEIVSENHLKVILNLEPQDYQKKVDDEIKSLSKKIRIDGFRPGKVPYGLAKKMYGDTVLAEELNKMISESLNGYITNKELRIFGEPLPVTLKENRISVLRPESYVFGFELGLMPEFTLAPLDTHGFAKQVLKISDKMIDEEMDRLRTRFGERENPESIGQEDILVGIFKELNDENAVKENGISSTTSFAIKSVQSDIARQQFMALQKNESTDINIHSAFGNDEELIIHHLLKIDHHKADQMGDRFRFTLTNIVRIKKAELNQEFFDKAFGEGSVSSEDLMRKKITEQMDSEYAKYTALKLDREILDYLLSETKIVLPAAFLRRLINLNQKEKKSEINDEEFSAAEKQIKQDLILNRLVSDHQIVPTEEEIKSEAKKDVLNYLGQDGSYFNANPEAFENIVESVMKDEKNAAAIQQRVVNEKLFALLRGFVKTETAEVDEHEFFHH